MAVTTAAIAGIVGAGVSIGTSVMSFQQAAEQKQKQKEAEAAAASAIEAARKRLKVNYYQNLSVQKEPYELAREGLLTQGVQTLEAAKEGENRGAGAVAGVLQMAQNQAERQISSDMSQEMQKLDLLRASEESRLRDANAELDKQQAEGAQLAAANAAELSAKATQQGFQGITTAANLAMDAIPLFGVKNNNKFLLGSQQDLAGLKLTPNELSQINSMQQTLGPLPNQTQGPMLFDPAAVGAMKPSQFNQYIKSLNPATKQFLINKINTYNNKQ